MSNTPTPNFAVTNCDFTYVAGDQTNYNYGYSARGARRFNYTAENPDPQTLPQDATGRNTRSEPSQAPPPPPPSQPPFAVHPQGQQQHSPQYQPNHGYPSPMPSASNTPIDLLGNPLPAQPSYSQLQTPVQSPLSSQWTPGSSVASTPQPLSPNPPFPHLASPNGSQATPPIQMRGHNGRRRSDRGPVPSKPKH